MFVESRVGTANQLFIESPLICAAFIAAHQQDRGAFRIECKCHSPYPTVMIETQLFHIGVLRAFERINRGPSQVRAEFLQESGVGEQLILERNTHRLHLGVKVIVE